MRYETDLRTFLLALILKRKVRVTLSLHLYREEEGCQSGNKQIPQDKTKGPGFALSGKVLLYNLSPQECHSKPWCLNWGQMGPGHLVARQGWCCLTFALHPSGEPATPLFSRFLQSDFPPGGLTGTLIIRLRKMKG